MSTAVPRLGIVGLGAIAQLKYLPILRRRRDLFRVTAVCDVSGELVRLVPDPGTQVARHTSLAAMLDGETLDAAVLLTSGSHGAPARRILEQGVPLLCEKPLALTVREIDELPRRPPLQLGYMKLHDPAVVEAARLIERGGRVRSVEVTVLHPPMDRQLQFLPAARRDVGADADSTGGVRERDRHLLDEALGPAAADRLGAVYETVLCGSLVHDLYVVRELVGDPGPIDGARSWPRDTFPPSVEVSAPLAEHGRLSLRWHHLADHPSYRETVAVRLEDGSVELVFPTPYRLHAPTTLRATGPWRTGGLTRTFRSAEDAFERQLEAFHGVVMDGDPPPVGIADGRADVRSCQQIARCLAGRQDVEIAGEAASA